MARDYQSALSHLTADQVADLMRRYYAGENTAALIQQYAVDVPTSRLYATFPRATRTDLMCPHCGSSGEDWPASRSGRGSAPRCTGCEHQFTDRCTCSDCTERDRAAVRETHDRRLQAIWDSYRAHVASPRGFGTLTYRERVLLAALLRASDAEDPSTIPPLGRASRVFAPTSEFTMALLSELTWDSRTIAIDPQSPLEAFVFPEDPNESWRYYPERVQFQLNVEPLGEQELELLLHPSDIVLSGPNEAAARTIWNQIGFAEVCQYLEHMVDRFNLRFRAGEKTHATIRTLLDSLSIAQVNGLVWVAVKNAAAAVQEGRMTNPHASNTIPGNMRRRAERFTANGWEIKPFNRDYNCPQTVLSSVFFNRIVEVGDDGFTLPSAQWVPAAHLRPMPLEDGSTVLATESPEAPKANGSEADGPSEPQGSTTRQATIADAAPLEPFSSVAGAIRFLVEARLARQPEFLVRAANPNKLLVTQFTRKLRDMRLSGLYEGRCRSRAVAKAMRQAAADLKREMNK